MELTEEELADTTASWDTHPFTLRTLQLFEQRLDGAMHELKVACARSSDPGVTSAYARYTTTAEHVAYYKQRSTRSLR